MEKPTPRVNSAALGNYVGQTVRLVGKIVSLSGDTALVEASDQGQVQVALNRDSHFTDNFVEIIGQVKDDLTLIEYASINMGNEIDMKLVDAVAALGPQYPELFTES